MLQLFQLGKHSTWKNHSVLAKFRIRKGLKKSGVTPFFGKFVTKVLIFRRSRSQMFFKIGALKSFSILELFLIKSQAFLYRTPTVAASGCSRQPIHFSAKSGIYWRQSHRPLSRTPLKTPVKPQKQPLQLFRKKRYF